MSKQTPRAQAVVSVCSSCKQMLTSSAAQRHEHPRGEQPRITREEMSVRALEERLAKRSSNDSRGA